MRSTMMCCRTRTSIIVAVVVTILCTNVNSIRTRLNDETHFTRTTAEPSNADINTSSSYAPVTLSSLASFARRFWTTMAGMASTTDGRLKRDNNETTASSASIQESTTVSIPSAPLTPTVITGSSGTTGLRFISSPPPPPTTNSGATIEEFPRSNRPTPKNSRPPFRRNNRGKYYPTTYVPTSIPKIVTPPPDANEFRRDHDSNVVRTSERLLSSIRSPADVTDQNDLKELEKSTAPCNETTSVRGNLEPASGILSPDVTTWPPPPPQFLRDHFSTLDDDRHRHTEDVSRLFTSEPSIYHSTDLDTDFEVVPGVASPMATPSESLLKDYTQSSRNSPLTKSTSDNQAEYSVTNVAPTLNSITRKPVERLRTWQPSPPPPTTNHVTTELPTTQHREPLTEPPTPDSEVSLVEIFDQDIIDNKTLLASSMFKLSTILTASLLTEEAATANSSSTVERPTTTVPSTPVDNETSDFDFSNLFTSESLSSSANSVTPSSSTLQSFDLVGENLNPPISDDVVLLSVVDRNSTLSNSNNRLASLMSTGVVNSFAVQDIDDVDDQNDDFEVVNGGFDGQFEEAGLTGAGSRDQPSLKTLNRFSALIRSPSKNSTEEPGECLFNVTDQAHLCDWTLDSQSSVHWSFGLGETAFMSGGPTLDSNGQTEGGYAFMDTSCGLQGASNEIQRGSFESPMMSKTAPHGRCFTFWYNMGGLSADRLRVLLIPEEQFHTVAQVVSRMPSFTTLWERKDSTNGTWMKGEVLYTFSKEHRLIFEGFARSGNDPRRKFQGYLAVDDFVIDSDSCQAFCTFEGVLCEWENEVTDDEFDWELARGSDSHLTGPVRDHGDGPEGGFMFIDTAFPRRPGDIARLRSPELIPTENGPICFRFWTHMYGNGIGTLRVVLIDSTDVKNVIWEVSGESGNSWHMAQVTVASSNPFRLSLEGMVGRNALGRIAIDDLSFGPGPCPSSPQSALPLRGDCTFESDECGWVNAGSGDHYDWLRTSAGQALLPGQGPNSGYRPPEPLSDHTTGLSSGFFLTMERSTIPPRGGDQAYVVGPTLHGTTGNNRCFSFWGYMHERSVDAAGPGLGSLRVYLRVGSSSILRPIWRLINYEHPDWFFAQAPINTDDKFQVVIGGTWGSTRQGAISVDDFTFFEGNCSVIPAEAEVIPGECTFDSNMCEWNSGLNRSRELSTWQLATSVRRPSNLDDHTYRATAGYVFFDIFSQQPHVVRLESPEITVDNETFSATVRPTVSADANNLDANDDDDDAVDTEHCLTFWFAPFGSSRNTFLRILQRDSASTNETQVWEVTTANFQAFRPEWVYGQVALNITYTHRIIFEGSSNNGGFALDDIMFVPGTCQSRPDNSP